MFRSLTIILGGTTRISSAGGYQDKGCYISRQMRSECDLDEEIAFSYYTNVWTKF